MARVSRGPRTQPRRIPRQSRSRATVDAILEAAARVLEQDGYERANVNRVAALAGVSVGSLYQYFPTKQALAAGVARQLSARMLETFGHDLADLGQLAPHQAIPRVVERAIEAFRLAPRLRRVLRDEVLAAGQVFDTPDFDATLRGAIAAYLQVHGDQVRPTDLHLAARLVMTAVQGVAEAWAGQPDVDSSALAAETADLVARYLLRDPPTPG